MIKTEIDPLMFYAGVRKRICWISELMLRWMVLTQVRAIVQMAPRTIFLSTTPAKVVQCPRVARATRVLEQMLQWQHHWDQSIPLPVAEEFEEAVVAAVEAGVVVEDVVEVAAVEHRQIASGCSLECRSSRTFTEKNQGV